jgi:hypothetical protein
METSGYTNFHVSSHLEVVKEEEKNEVNLTDRSVSMNLKSNTPFRHKERKSDKKNNFDSSLNKDCMMF